MQSPPPPPDGGAGPMGGTIGEGMLNDPGMNNNAMGSGNFNTNNNNFGQQPPTNSGYPPNNINANATIVQPPNMNQNPGMGSITQFASGLQQPQKPQQQQPNMMQSSWQSGNNSTASGGYGASSIVSGATSPAPGSFAARSVQAHSHMGQPQQPGGMMVNQQATNNQYQPQQPGMMPNNNSMMHQSSMMQTNSMMPQQQQGFPQQTPPGPQYRPTGTAAMEPSPQRPMTSNSSVQSSPAPGSFAARSVQAFSSNTTTGMPQQQAGMMQQPQQQQSPYRQPQQQNMYGQQQQQQNMYGQQQPNQQQPYGQQQQQYNNQQQQPQFQQNQQQMGQQSQYGQQQQQPGQAQYSQQQQPASQFPSSAPQAPQTPSMASYGGASVITTATGVTTMIPGGKPQPSWAETPAQIAVQNRLLTDATRKVQEHAYYMRQAIEKNDLPNVLDRASLMVGQLGEIHGPSHHQAGHPGPNAPPPGGEAAQLNPKNYYELHMRALEDMPNFEEYLMTVSGHSQQLQQPVDPNRITITMTATPTAADAQFSMKELYDCVQYCPQVLPRLYLQICAGSALIQSGEVGTKWVMNDLMQATKCVQNPVRGLFLRHYLLQMIRDKLPDSSADTTPLAGQAAMDAAEEGKEEVTPSVPPEKEPGTVADSYHFILANFIEMNKLWVRIQHLAGDGRSKDQRKRRERQRNELRILVGTNLVRLSQLEGVTSKIYGEIILPTVLDHIVVCGDPLAQAYLIDCITQVFPDEYHIETLPILLRVCPKLRDKVNVRTILQSLMDRLANYLADEELLDETDTNQVKKNMAQDSFPMFEECVQNVYNARGPKLGAKEVIRLQTALLSFSLRCFQGDMEQVNRCLQGCVAALKQANASYELQEGTMAEVPGSFKPLDDVSTAELEKLLSIPLDSLAMKVLQLPDYGELLSFLPWAHRREVALKLLKAVDDAAAPPKCVKDIEELFGMVEPLISDVYGSQQMGLTMPGQPQGQAETENALVCKLVHLLDHEDTDVVYDMLMVARQHINKGGVSRAGQTLVAVVFATFRLAQRVFAAEHGVPEVSDNAAQAAETAPAEETPAMGEEATTTAEESPSEEDKKEESGDSAEAMAIAEDAEPESTTPAAAEEPKEEDGIADVAVAAPVPAPSAPPPTPKTVSCRKLFVFIQQTIAMVASSNVEMAFKLYLQAALTADRFAGSRKDPNPLLLDTFGPMPYELITQAFVIFEQGIADSKVQHRCIVCIMSTLLECGSLSDEDYQGLVMKTAQYSAKMLKKSDQCTLVAQCSHLFFPAEHPHLTYRNEQRALECLQRSLKLADACTSTNPAEIHLFVDLLDHYLSFFEQKCPVITDAYVTGLLALIKEHLGNLGNGMGYSNPAAINDARAQYQAIVQYIKEKKANAETAEHFAPINAE
ncbi:protein sorting-associated protein 35 [Seminavis robusta]|uniref:Protein sorting-associated protein 35 n=1 Tax=Seminavis robusta TaxID=568900 RepID=A0A9N8DAU6_9STRA|nr:protein sorting-associated protein 35 [Seminavis robusta]|eukprot:Sro37_g023370.1 protein sorting-associated protein 35 (1401) ;mRNA; r:118962-123269